MDDPLIGSVLGGAKLIQRVSKGVMAHVYQAQHGQLGIPVAVKVLTKKATAQGVNRERFVREGQALQKLQHDNIIRIHAVGQEQGAYFIVMDWIQDGVNLRQLAQTRPLTPAQSLKVVQRLCGALDYIHALGLIHRDIKPANVCLRRGGHPVLMDFSLIKDQHADVQLTAAGTIMGTVNFMPPEQAQPGGAFGEVSARSDVYGLGGTLYWLLTGKPPFKGRTPMDTIIKLMRESPAAPSTHNPTIPGVVDQLALQCLAKQPDQRPGSARDLALRIEQIFQNHAAELEAAQRPALAETSGRAPQQPAAPAQPAAAASWGAGSGASGAQGAATAVQPIPAVAAAAPPPVQNPFAKPAAAPTAPVTAVGVTPVAPAVAPGASAGAVAAEAPRPSPPVAPAKRPRGAPSGGGANLKLVLGVAAVTAIVVAGAAAAVYAFFL